MGKSILLLWTLSMLISVNLYALDLFYGISSALDYKSGWINRFIEGLAALRWATSGYLSSWIFEDKMRGRRVFIRFLGVNSFHYISTIYLFDLVLTSLVYGISFAVAILMTSSEVEHIDMQAQYLGLSLFLTWNANLIGQNLILRTTSERMQLVSPLLIIIQYFMGYGADLLQIIKLEGVAGMLFPHSCLMKAGYLIQKGYYIDSNDFYCLRKNMILSIPIWFAIALAIDMLESTRPI